MKKLILLLTIAVVVTECGMHNRISSLRDNHVSAGLALPQETFIPSLKNRQEEKDTIEVSEPENVLIMNAVKDENGEMTATDVIRAAMVTARFRNVAERHGKVDLKFQVVVPGELQDSRWQLKLYPDMFVMEDSIRLEPVVVTGAQYRRRQMKGYEQYRKFLDSIISDPDSFINIGQLEIFIKRNIPELYKFRTDSSAVSDEEFASVYGVTEQAAVEHYTNKFRYQKNERRKSKTDKMYRKYVKAPIVTEGIRLELPGAFALVRLAYDEEVVKAAATETVTVGGYQYPVISFKFNCTGFLADGTQVEELFILDYYINGYEGSLP